MATAAGTFARVWATPPGLGGALKAVSHKPIGRRYLVTSFLFFLAAGVEALLLRVQLVVPENDFLGPDTYNAVFTMHGSTMMFLFVVPFVEGLANFVLPLMLGARDLPFPRLNAFNYWTYLFGGLFFYSSIFVDAPKGGWFAYVPLTGSEFMPGKGMDFWLLGITLLEISAIGAAVELIVVTLKMRAPGLSLGRLPLFAWSFLVTGLMIVFAFTPLLLGSVLLQADRRFGTHFYDPAAGGSPVLWQHFFWIFGHPEVYIMFLPATGIVSQVVQTFTGRAIVGYLLVVLAIVTTGVMSFGLWVHHMYTVGVPIISSSFFAAASLMIAVASGVQVFAWIATIWRGRPRFTTPMLFVVGFVITFVLGGITGVMVALVPFDWQVHDSYFLVAHFHYVLIGGVVFPILAGLHYWFPKLAGRVLDERLGKASFWLAFVGFNLTFFPMHVTGLVGMPRRVYTYEAGLGWETLNLLSTIGAFVLASGFLAFVANAVLAFRGREEVPENPWDADTLEWATASPPSDWNFRTLPVVRARHPLWEQDDLHEDGEPDVAPAAAIAERPERWRATLGTSVLEARPVELIHLPAPTPWPLWLSLAFIVAAVGLLTSQYVIAAGGAVLALVALVAWGRLNEREREAVRREGIEVGGLPLNVSGPGGVGWWGVILFLAAAATVLASLVFAYFYLRFHNAEWPVGGIEPPPLVPAAIATTVLVASAAPVFWASRATGRLRLAAGLGLGFLLGAAVLAFRLVDLAGLPFTGGENAYTSVFVALAGSDVLVLLAALAVSLAVQARAWRRPLDERGRLLAGYAALGWYFAVLTSATAYATLYLGPLTA